MERGVYDAMCTCSLGCPHIYLGPSRCRTEQGQEEEKRTAGAKILAWEKTSCILRTGKGGKERVLRGGVGDTTGTVSLRVLGALADFGLMPGRWEALLGTKVGNGGLGCSKGSGGGVSGETHGPGHPGWGRLPWMFSVATFSWEVRVMQEREVNRSRTIPGDKEKGEVPGAR